ncbi:MAG TPA: hypothetical protein VGS12_10780 [Caulobacteraceae bacterium]|nr:hypothetical protein [Caulobacteraceae bacterium]
MLKSVIVVAALAVGAPAFAASSHLTDAQYMQAARCEALMSAPALGAGDKTAIRALMRRESVGRTELAQDQADEMRRDAARAASHAGSYERASLIAERDGVCASLLGQQSASVSNGVTSN